MSCDVVRLELGEVAEGLRRMSPPVRRHVKMCDRCGAFRKQLRETNKALAAVFPIGPLVLMKKFALVHLGIGGASGSATAAGGVAGGAAAGSAVGAGAAGGGLLAGSAATIATKAAAGLAAAALVTAGAVEVHNAANQRRGGTHDIAAAQPQAPVTSAAPTFTHALAGRREAPHTRTRVVSHPVRAPKKDPVDSKVAADKVAKATQPAPATDPTATEPTTAAPDAAATAPTQPATDPPKTQTSGDTTTLPPETTSTAPTTTAPPTTTAAPATTTPAAPPPTTVPPDVPLPSQASPPADQGGGAPPQDGGGSPPSDQSPADLSQPAS
jgi:hypothetical protein